MSGSAPGSGPQESVRPDRRRRRRLVLAAAIAAAVILGGFIVASTVGGDEGVPVVAASPEATTRTPRATDTPTKTADPAPAETETPAETGAAPDQPAPDAAPEGPEDPGLANQDLTVAEPVAIDGGSSEAGGLDIRVAAMEAVDGVAIGIGEIAGPSVRFTVSVANGSDEPVDLSNAVLTVEAGPDRLPCTELSGPGTSPFPAEAKPGETATGIYVFLIPAESRNDVTVYLNYSVDASVAAFRGTVPEA